MNDIAKFIAGFEKFQEKYFGEEREMFERLSQGQQPKTLLIACCDSRVDPALLTGAGPGEVFVIRNIANLVPPYQNDAESPGIRSAIEFAVKALEVEHIIVLGHSQCGGIQALMEGEAITHKNFEFIGPWVSIANRARERVLLELPQKPPELQARACEMASILLSLENLLTFPWIQSRADEGKILLHGWYFDIEKGELLAYSERQKTFQPLVSEYDAVN